MGLGGWGVHLRLPAVLGAMLFASASYAWCARDRARRRRPAAARWCQLRNAGAELAGYDRQYGEFRAALQGVPEGSRMMTVLDSDSLSSQSDSAPDQPYWHMAEFALVDRGAFTP